MDKKHDAEIFSAHNEVKSVIAEKFIGALKNKFYKYKTTISKNVYIDELSDVVHKYNNTNYNTIKTKPADVKPNKYIDPSKEIKDKDPKFENSDIVRISKYKNTFAKAILQVGLKKFLLHKILCRGHMLLVISNAKKLLECFTKKKEKKQIKKSLELKK